MQLKKIFMLSFVLLSACNFQGIPDRDLLSSVEPTFNYDVYDKGGKAYVIIDAYNNVPTRITIANYFIFTKENGEEIKMSVSDKTGPKSYMLSPGNYKLKKYYIYGAESAGNYTTIVDLNFQNYIDGEFSVDAGEVVYLGKADFHIKSVQRRLFYATTPKDIVFETKVVNDFDKINHNKQAFFEQQAGKKPVVKLMKWKKAE